MTPQIPSESVPLDESRRTDRSQSTDKLQNTDELWMREALAEAQKCLERAPADVPVGALCVFGGQVIARAHNRREIDGDPTAHAEVLALRAAAQHLGRWRLDGVTLYVTLEPCPMCAGAAVHARIRRLIFGSRDLRFGGVRSKFRIADSELLNHSVEVVEGVLAAESVLLLKQFFGIRR